jgi:hypothetical protein
MKFNKQKLEEEIELNCFDIGVKTTVRVSEIKPLTAKKCGLLALEFKKLREELI